jgi:hypothetical protein
MTAWSRRAGFLLVPLLILLSEILLSEQLAVPGQD